MPLGVAQQGYSKRSSSLRFFRFSSWLPHPASLAALPINVHRKLVSDSDEISEGQTGREGKLGNFKRLRKLFCRLSLIRVLNLAWSCVSSTASFVNCVSPWLPMPHLTQVRLSNRVQCISIVGRCIQLTYGNEIFRTLDVAPLNLRTNGDSPAFFRASTNHPNLGMNIDVTHQY